MRFGRRGAIQPGVTRLRVQLDGPLDAASALGGAAALALELDAACPAALYAAPLEGEAIVLGAHQRAESALAPGWLPSSAAARVLRRVSGGAAVLAGEGRLYVALVLREPSALTACPPGKVLNRYARGVLGGLRTLGVPANYFGRDFVSAGAEPVSYIGWSVQPDGQCWVESFIALNRPFALPAELNGYPRRSEPAFRGRPLTTVRASTAHAPLDAAAVLEAVANGHLRAFGAERVEQPPSTQERQSAERLAAATRVSPDERPLSWSAPVEDAIGFVEAGVALDRDGRLAELSVCGDFFQHADCPVALRDELLGQPADSEIVGAALDRVYAAGPGLIEGLRSLRSLQAALLDAAQRARG